ncbi:MAG: hypothetical protein EOO29_09070 [Comamonadaceae bacterium]|nr:MAG: hypothetical protein EOO29_09070 [Comamonadaceae bacterium]
MTYYRTDLVGDLLDSAAESCRQAARLRDEGNTPKWLLIAMHSTVQGAMVCALNQGNGIAAMKDTDARKWFAAHEQSRTDDNVRYPTTQVDYFLSLYAKVKNPAHMSHVFGAVPFTPIDHDEQIRQLNELRNEFIHFGVGHWEIKKSLVVECVQRGADVVRFLVESPVFPWHRRDCANEERGSVIRNMTAVSECIGHSAFGDVSR